MWVAWYGIGYDVSGRGCMIGIREEDCVGRDEEGTSQLSER